MFQIDDDALKRNYIKIVKMTGEMHDQGVYWPNNIIAPYFTLDGNPLFGNNYGKLLNSGNECIGTTFSLVIMMDHNLKIGDLLNWNYKDLTMQMTKA